MDVLLLQDILGVTLYKNVSNLQKNACSHMAVTGMSMDVSEVLDMSGVILSRNVSDLGKKIVLKKYIKMYTVV